MKKNILITTVFLLLTSCALFYYFEYNKIKNQILNYQCYKTHVLIGYIESSDPHNARLNMLFELAADVNRIECYLSKSTYKPQSDAYNPVRTAEKARQIVLKNNLYESIDRQKNATQLPFDPFLN